MTCFWLGIRYDSIVWVIMRRRRVSSERRRSSCSSCHYYIWDVCVQLSHFSLGDWKDISIARVIIIIKSEVSTFPLSYFPWLCAWDVCCIIFCHLLYIYSEKTGILFSLLLRSLWWVHIVGYVWLPDRIRLFLHYTILLSSLCKHIWKHWTYNMPVRYILSSV